MIKQKFDETERIVHHLMLETFFMNDIGLLHGQMGVILALSEYSKFAKNKIYFDMSSYLLDNIMEKVQINSPFSFVTGLSGIGWGIEYLIQNGFVEGETVEICEEIDYKIIESDPERIMDLSLETGFEGLLHYVIYHLQGAIKQNTKLPFDEKYLSDLYTACMKLKKQNVNTSIDLLLGIYIRFMSSCIIKDYTISVSDFIISGSTILIDTISSAPLGIKDGLAGRLLKTIQKT